MLRVLGPTSSNNFVFVYYSRQTAHTPITSRTNANKWCAVRVKPGSARTAMDLGHMPVITYNKQKTYHTRILVFFGMVHRLTRSITGYWEHHNCGVRAHYEVGSSARRDTLTESVGGKKNFVFMDVGTDSDPRHVRAQCLMICDPNWNSLRCILDQTQAFLLLHYGNEDCAQLHRR